MIYKTHGIIIKRSNLFESDRIITIYTKNKGKIKAIAKGSRKIHSKLSGNLELFCLSNFTIAEGKNIDIITGAQIEKCFLDLRKNLHKTRVAQYFAELIEKMTEISDPHPEIFLLFLYALENINTKYNRLVIPYFEWNLLSQLGYHPELEKCVKCREKVQECENIYFDSAMGGLICTNCEKGQKKISVTVIKILRLFLRNNFNKISKIKINRLEEKEIFYITRSFLKQKSEKKINSQKFLY